MDSNFQVKITADLGDLTAKIKNIEATLAKLDSSFKAAGAVASTSFKDASKTIANVGMDMNRARLATFAFGQVIRDAGFFSQSFGLGLLAISNNVPILIDQLVMLSGVSAGVGAAISLLGSVLTAGLTIFAYWAQGVQRDGKSVGGAIQKMALDSENIIGKLIEFLSRPPASEILNGVISGVITGFDAIKGWFEAYADLLKQIWNKFGNDITNGTSRAFTSLKDTVKNILTILIGFVKLSTGLISGDFNLMGKAITSIFKGVFNQIINYFGFFINILSSGIGKFVSLTSPALGAAISQAGKNFQDFASKNQFATEKLVDFNFNLKDSIASLKFSDDAVKKKTKSTDKLAEVYKTLADEIKIIKYDTFSSELEKANKLVDVHKKALESLIKLGVSPLSKEYKNLSDQMLDANKKLFGEEGKIFAAKLQGLTIANQAKLAVEAESDAKEKQIAAQKELNALGNDSVAGSISDDPTYAILEKRNEAYDKQNKKINDTRELLTDMGNILVGPLAGAFETMFRTGEFGFKSIISALAQVIAKLLAAIAAAVILAVVISVATGGAAGGGKSFGKAFAGLMGGKGMFPGLVPRAKGGIFSGPSAALVGEYPGAKNNPEVIAPLDKLKSLMVNTDSGQMMGQLEAKISGNDLVILMNRASKNRNGYY
jgi:hypothetical protein